MSTLIIPISAMCCPAEGGPVEQVLRAAPGVADVTLDYSTRTARVTGNRISGEALLEALLSIGMPGELVVTGARRIVLSVPEMDCPVEAGEIQKAFAAAGITGADFNVITRTVTLSGDDDLEAAAVRAPSNPAATRQRPQPRAPGRSKARRFPGRSTSAPSSSPSCPRRSSL